MLSTVLGGGVANLGRFGIASSVIGLYVAKQKMEAARDAEALVALRALQSDLDAIAQNISLLDHDLEATGPGMSQWASLGSSDTSGPDELGFSIGSPQRPDIEWDEDFIYDSQSANPGDYANAAKWKAKSAGARLLKGDLGDALDAYDHYWSITGDPFTIDLEKAYSDDASIASNIDSAIRIAQQSADGYAASGRSDFSMTGEAGAAGDYPVTENWQKTVGGHRKRRSG